jgi:hypothetical protein
MVPLFGNSTVVIACESTLLMAQKVKLDGFKQGSSRYYSRDLNLPTEMNGIWGLFNS